MHHHLHKKCVRLNWGRFATLITVLTCPPIAASEVDFNRDIRPILSSKCFACHGPDSASRKADLRLDKEDVAKADRDGHPVIVVGQPGRSELVSRITATD